MPLQLYSGKHKNFDLVNEFKPWYYDGKSVWWGTLYPLRSDAEAAALKLQKRIKLKSNDNKKSLEIQEQ